MHIDKFYVYMHGYIHVCILFYSWHILYWICVFMYVSCNLTVSLC